MSLDEEKKREYYESVKRDNFAASTHLESSCKCDIRTKLLGDGCSKCNPEHMKEN